MINLLITIGCVRVPSMTLRIKARICNKATFWLNLLYTLVKISHRCMYNMYIIG